MTPGLPYPLGATITNRGVNFSIFSRHAEYLELLLFDQASDQQPRRVIHLNPKRHRTWDFWHVHVAGLRPGQRYAYRAHGPWAPDLGLRFDRQKVLLDPYARCVEVPARYSRSAAARPGPTLGRAMLGVVADLAEYDWQGDAPPRHDQRDTVIYEMHVAGFTKHPNSGVEERRRGTYHAVIEKIPYLQALGVTSVELLPVFQFDAQDAPPGHNNYWGYCPVSFFAPHQGYGCSAEPLAVLDEFRDMVKALHRADIEVILDVVYNHTAEGGENGPTLSFKGLDNTAYYLLQDNPRQYSDFSGTGNTLSANTTIVSSVIRNSLRYWVQEMHVDGFRFDLASILTRGTAGQPLVDPPLLLGIEADPILAGCKLVAEPWDAGGLYQVGRFLGDRFLEWNGRFRDDVRRFIRADRGSVRELPARLLASPDLFLHEQREPEQSINFITSHDGFTLADLVSYDAKHNEANGEQNRDGADYNCSWNHGVEGPTNDPRIDELRLRQSKNLLAILFLSSGTPMLGMGDEVRRTQQGNNNAYVQDNPLSWFDWDLVTKNAGLLRFVQALVRKRRSQATLPRGTETRTLQDVLVAARISWHGVRLNEPDWSDHSHSIAMSAQIDGYRMYLILNSHTEPLQFELPEPEPNESGWVRVVDTALASPDDIVSRSAGTPVSGHCVVAARSVVLLEG